MAPKKKYATPNALRSALETRLQQISIQERVDLQTLRRRVAFDRLLARLFDHEPSPWALKGGYAMELRLAIARATRDIDLTLRSGGSRSNKGENQNQEYQRMLQIAVNLDLADFFSFVVKEAMHSLDAAPYGGARFPVESMLADRAFVKFHVDIGVGDVLIDPLEKIRCRDWLGFAGIPGHSVNAIPREQQFAEKIHAYTLPRSRVNSRTRDLIDLVLLIESGSLDQSKISDALEKTFERRKSHEIPESLEPPPPTWASRFTVMARQCNLPQDLRAAFEQVQKYFEMIIRKAKS